jgi:hypothetical protein
VRSLLPGVLPGREKASWGFVACRKVVVPDEPATGTMNPSTGRFGVGAAVRGAEVGRESEDALSGDTASFLIGCWWMRSRASVEPPTAGRPRDGARVTGALTAFDGTTVIPTLGAVWSSGLIVDECKIGECRFFGAPCIKSGMDCAAWNGGFCDAGGAEEPGVRATSLGRSDITTSYLG